MSNVNIKRAVENIRANTTVYTPVVEMVVNAIQAVDETGRKDGEVAIRVHRSRQTETDGRPDVIGFSIEDNGIGFNKAHRDSFDTLYTDIKINEGGKGFGRFTCLKYFEDLRVNSVYRDGSACKARTFSMGKKHDIIVGEKVTGATRIETGSTVMLAPLKTKHTFDKKLTTTARNLVERLLPYFIAQDYMCPRIVLSEEDGSGAIHLNDFVRNEMSAEIQEIGVDQQTFTLKARTTDEEFLIRVFKFYSPRNQKSRISLVAHKREVSGSAMDKYIPEFEDEFYEKGKDGQTDRDRNYIVKAYVFGPYLDSHVSLERGGFEFAMDNELFMGIAQADIETKAAIIARDAMGEDITLRQEKKRDRIQAYVDEEAPWHKEILGKIDLSEMPYKPSNEEIEIRLQKEKFAQEVAIKSGVARLLAESNFENVKESVLEIVSKISGTGRNDLIHYIALRRKILDIFAKSLEVDASGAYSSEGVVHDIIFPRRGNTDIIPFHDHNLWIVDERLNFTTYVSSDEPLDGKNTVSAQQTPVIWQLPGYGQYTGAAGP